MANKLVCCRSQKPHRILRMDRIVAKVPIEEEQWPNRCGNHIQILVIWRFTERKSNSTLQVVSLWLNKINASLINLKSWIGHSKHSRINETHFWNTINCFASQYEDDYISSSFTQSLIQKKTTPWIKKSLLPSFTSNKFKNQNSLNQGWVEPIWNKYL